MASEVFIDTSGWYALLDRRDSAHQAARKTLEGLIGEQRRLVTSDYVIDETCTLTKARAGGAASLRFLRFIDETAVLRVEWIGADRFDATRNFYEKQIDHEYSFTDCTSFVLMRELKLTDAMTTDSHFSEAGFSALLQH